MGVDRYTFQYCLFYGGGSSFIDLPRLTSLEILDYLNIHNVELYILVSSHIDGEDRPQVYLEDIQDANTAVETHTWIVLCFRGMKSPALFRGGKKSFTQQAVSAVRPLQEQGSFEPTTGRLGDANIRWRHQAVSELAVRRISWGLSCP